MSFSSSSVAVIDASGVVQDFQTNQSSPYNYSFPAGSTGIWAWVVSRAGYRTQIGTFNASTGGQVNASPSPTIRLQPDGTNMYTSTNSANVSVSFDLTTAGSERGFIDIGNASVSAQVILDEVEDALETQDGCRFLAATNGSEVTLAELPAGNFLFLDSGWRVRRASPSDTGATVEAFLISSDGIAIDGTNGEVAILSANLTEDGVRDAVWGAVQSNYTTAGTFGFLLDAQVSDISGGAGGSGPTAGEIYTEFTSGNNADAFKADVSLLATLASVQGLNDLSTTDIDARLTAYDVPTKAELDVAQASIENEITAIPAGATPQEVWEYTTRGLTQAVSTDSTSRSASQADVSGIPAAVRASLAVELARIDVTISSRSSHAAPDLTNLDATISSRLADTDYTVPPNVAAIADAVWDELASEHTTEGTFGDHLDTDVSGVSSSGGGGTVDANIIQVNGTSVTSIDVFKADVSSIATQASVDAIPTTPLLAASYIAPNNAAINAIRAKTDLIMFTGTDIHATLDGEEVTTDANSRTASRADVASALAAYDASTQTQLIAARDATIDTLINAIYASFDGNTAGVFTITFTDERNSSTITRTVTITNNAGNAPESLGDNDVALNGDSA